MNKIILGILLTLMSTANAATLIFNGQDASFSIKYPGCTSFMLTGVPPNQELKCMGPEVAECTSIHGAGPQKGQCAGYNEIDFHVNQYFTTIDGKKISVSTDRTMHVR